MENNTSICVKKEYYRVEKNNFTILYDGLKDEFFLGIKNFDSLNLNDLKDLHNLTKRILRYNKK
jgi:hypothetical protein